MERQLVVFELAGEHYGVDIAAVESIIKMQTITAVPHAPAFVEGVINLRGKVLPVVDLRERFGLPSQEIGSDSRIIVVNLTSMEIGMIVDAVSEVLTVSDSAIEPPPPLVITIDSSFITGIAKMADRLIILLDLSRVLSLNERVELQSLQ